MGTHRSAAGAGTPSGDGKFVGSEGRERSNGILLAQALRLARDGFHVLPRRSDNSLACKQGLQNASQARGLASGLKRLIVWMAVAAILPPTTATYLLSRLGLVDK